MICTSLLLNVDIAVIIIRPRALRCSLLQMSVGVSVEHIGEFCKTVELIKMLCGMLSRFQGTMY